MAETEQEKTEEPTEKKLTDAREKGDVPISQDVRHAVMFAAILLLLGALGANATRALSQIFIALWGGADQFSLGNAGAQATLSELLLQVTMAIAPLLGVPLAFAASIFVLQGRPVITWSRLALKWSALSPTQGFTRIFGRKGLFEFAKYVVKAALITGLAVMAILPQRASLAALVGAEPVYFVHQLVQFLLLMLKPVVVAIALLAGADLFFQNRSYIQRMRMTLQEIRDELKDSEGNPLIKSKRRSIAVARARRRMMAAVPTASVVITNPTHYSVALKYEHGVNNAPVVVAKGLDNIAFKIREVAAEAGVPVVESPPLARALYAMVDIDHPIPVEHYTAVAEIISFVMRLSSTRTKVV
jgi:flagellar biosynthetic protein FlhB